MDMSKPDAVPKLCAADFVALTNLDDTLVKIVVKQLGLVSEMR